MQDVSEHLFALQTVMAYCPRVKMRTETIFAIVSLAGMLTADGAK